MVCAGMHSPRPGSVLAIAPLRLQRARPSRSQRREANAIAHFQIISATCDAQIMPGNQPCPGQGPVDPRFPAAVPGTGKALPLPEAELPAQAQPRLRGGRRDGGGECWGLWGPRHQYSLHCQGVRVVGAALCLRGSQTSAPCLSHPSCVRGTATREPHAQLVSIAVSGDCSQIH